MQIDTLVKMYLNGELLLPEMQRKYVWNSTKVRNLLDSIYRDYPSGSILMWQSSEAPEIRDSTVVPEGGPSARPFTQKLYLLDGQQRITSLATIATGQPIRIKDGDELVERHVDIYFNLDHPEKLEIESDDTAGILGEDFDARNDDARNRFFQVRNSAIENQPNWISVTKLFREGTGSILNDLKIPYDDPRYDRYYKRLNRLFTRKENYVYPVQTLPESVSYQEATDVFIRVNSAGTRLSGPDLALALVTSRWPGSMRLFDEFVAECHRADFVIEAGFLIRCVMALATGQSRFDRIGKIRIEEIKAAWEQTKPGIEYAINFIKNNARIQTSAVIPSLYALVPLSVYAVKQGLNYGSEEKDLLKWFYAASMWGRYGRGSSESILDEDLADLTGSHPATSLMENIIGQTGRIEVKDTDLASGGVRSPFFMMSYVLAMRNSAKDWGTGLAFSLTSIGKGHKVQHDHIFPRAKTSRLLRETNPALSSQDVKSLVNDMANIAFLSERENPHKSDREPKQYLAKIRRLYGDEALTAQYIPLEEDLWEMRNYEQFLRVRRSMLVSAINDLMSCLENREPMEAISVPRLVSNGESELVEFKSSLRWDYKNNSVNSVVGLAVAKAIASFMNAKGGTLLIGVDDSGQILGVEKDFLTFGPEKQNADGFQLHLVQLVKNYLGIEHMEQTHVKFETVDGKTIARITIDRSPTPVFLKVNDKTEFYVKMGNSSQPLNSEETVRYVQSHWWPKQPTGLHTAANIPETIDIFNNPKESKAIQADEGTKQREEVHEVKSISDQTPLDQDAIPKLTRRELSGLRDGVAIICPARLEGVDFLLRYASWGFISIRRKPIYFILYIKNPVGYTKYFAKVDRILDPVSSESPVKNYKDFTSFRPGKKIIVLERNSLREITDGLRIGKKYGFVQGSWYTSLGAFISAASLDDTT
jgi:hypothetical protein